MVHTGIVETPKPWVPGPIVIIWQRQHAHQTSRDRLARRCAREMKPAQCSQEDRYASMRPMLAGAASVLLCLWLGASLISHPRGGAGAATLC